MAQFPNRPNTRRHDAITTWLADSLADETIANDFLNPAPRAWHAHDLVKLERERRERAAADFKEEQKNHEWRLREGRPSTEPVLGELSPFVVPDRPVFRCDAPKRERAISNGNGRAVAFLDLSLDVSYPVLDWNRVNYYTKAKDWTLEITWEPRTFNFEIKPDLDALSELIRQINGYRLAWNTHIKRRAYWIAVAPIGEPEATRILGQEGIGFVAAPPELAAHAKLGLAS